MVINFRGKQKMATDYRHTRSGAIWCEDAMQWHRPLLPPRRANKMGFNPTGREETYFGPGGRQEGSADGGRC